MASPLGFDQTLFSPRRHQVALDGKSWCVSSLNKYLLTTSRVLGNVPLTVNKLTFNEHITPANSFAVY